MKRGFLLVIVIIALAGLTHACSPPSDGAPAEPVGPPPDALVPPGAEEVVELAKAELAKRRVIDKDKIAVVGVESVDWPDTSLGCPEPGMMYAQVITPGYKILLSYAEEIYEYRSDQNDRVVYCQNKSGKP